ncbi:MAG: peptidoglycan recognition family protein [Pseudomonadota bacterium]
MAELERIHLHWTAGAYAPNMLDRRAYHQLVGGDGTVFQGRYEPEDNLDTSDGRYARHTLNANTGAIGVALCAMRGARERPFSWGKYPINADQLAVFVQLVADLADHYGIEVSRETVLTHAEIEPTLGIKQNAKWDITVLPGMEHVEDPVVVGDQLRTMIAGAMIGDPVLYRSEADLLMAHDLFRTMPDAAA